MICSPLKMTLSSCSTVDTSSGAGTEPSLGGKVMSVPLLVLLLYRITAWLGLERTLEAVQTQLALGLWPWGSTPKTGETGIRG